MSIFPAKILFATDGSEEATLAAETAADIADKTGSELHLIHTRQMPPYVDEAPTERMEVSKSLEETLKEAAQRVLDSQVEQIKRAGGNVTQAHIRLGRADKEIVTLADELNVGLIVIGSRGMGGIRRALMGSVSDSVLRHAHCPVLVVRKEER